MRQQKPANTRRKTPAQEEYRAWHHAFDRAKCASARVGFIEAAAEWQKEKARKVAEDAAVF